MVPAKRADKGDRWYLGRLAQLCLGLFKGSLTPAGGLPQFFHFASMLSGFGK